MPFGLIPLAIGAIGAIGSLIKRRRSSQALAGASFARSANSQPTATPGISDAASNPNSAQTPAGAANTGRGVGAAQIGGPQLSDAARGAGPGSKNTTLEAQGFQQNSGDEASKAVGPLQRPPAQPATGPQQADAGSLGEAAIKRSRERNAAQRKGL